VDAHFRIVTTLPLRELWRDDGFSTTARRKSLTHEEVKQLLVSGPVQFVIADVGAAPRWIPASDCFNFWRNEAKPHVVSGQTVSLDGFPGGYCYFPSQWDGREAEAPIIVLEKHH